MIVSDPSLKKFDTITDTTACALYELMAGQKFGLNWAQIGRQGAGDARCDVHQAGSRGEASEEPF